MRRAGSVLSALLLLDLLLALPACRSEQPQSAAPAGAASAGATASSSKPAQVTEAWSAASVAAAAKVAAEKSTGPATTRPASNQAQAASGSAETKTAQSAASSEAKAKDEKAAVEAKAASKAGAAVGVPECDDYLTKYERCLAKIPEASREMLQRTITASREAWIRASVTQDGREGVAAACKAALQAAKAAMAPYRCEW